MDIVDLSKLRVYIDNKIASNIVSLGLKIDESTMPYAIVNVHQRFPAEGLFNSGVDDRVTGYVLENWRDEVLRLRSVDDKGEISEDKEEKTPLTAEEYAVACGEEHADAELQAQDEDED